MYYGRDTMWTGLMLKFKPPTLMQNLFYLESLLILKHRPTLNKMQTSVNINLFT